MAASRKAAEAQAKQEVRKASLDDLLNKRPLRRSVTIYNGGEPIQVEVQSIGRKKYANLAEDCEVTKEYPKVDDDGNEVEGETEERTELGEDFFPRLIAASLTAAGLEVTVEQVEAFYDEWNAAEFDELAMAAYEVNTRHKVDRLGNA